MPENGGADGNTIKAPEQVTSAVKQPILHQPFSEDRLVIPGSVDTVSCRREAFRSADKHKP